MPEERIYQPQVMPRAAAPMPLASPEAFGAGLGQQLAATGEQLHRDQLRSYQIERQRKADDELTTFQRDFANARENMDGIAREARKDGSEGHAARMGQAWSAQRDTLLEGITEGSVRRRAEAQLDEWGGRFRAGEADFEELKRSERVLTNYASTRDISANRIRRLEKPDDYVTEIDLGHQAIDGLSVPVDVKAKLHRDWEQQGAVAFLRGRIDADPQLAKAMIAGGLFDHALEPDQVEQLLNGADVEIRRQDAQAEHAANVAQAAFRQDVRTTQAAAAGGVDVSDQLPGLIERANALGLPDVATTLHNDLAESRFAKAYEPQTPIQREERMRALEAKAKRSGDEDRELKWLKDHNGALDASFNKNPADFFARNGGAGAPPPIDWTDPASLTARSAWARATAAAVGRPVPPLTSNEAAELGAHWSTGKTAEQSAVLEQLAMLPGDQAGAAARQVDPGDPRLAVMAVLPPRARKMALIGRDLLKADPKRLHVDDPEITDAMARADQQMNDALTVFPPNQRAAIHDTAARILAATIDELGGTVTPARYRQALNQALGATWSADRSTMMGGLATWGDRAFAVPAGMTKDEFAPAIMRARQRGAVKPVNPDGSPADLTRAFPVMVASGVYEFHTPAGGVVMGSDKKPWRVTPRPAR